MCSFWPEAGGRPGHYAGEQPIQTLVVSGHALHAGRQHRDERIGRDGPTARRRSRRAWNSKVQPLSASPRTVWKVLQHNAMGTSGVYSLGAPNAMAGRTCPHPHGPVRFRR
jgi:hypothetical protein